MGHEESRWNDVQCDTIMKYVCQKDRGESWVINPGRVGYRDNRNVAATSCQLGSNCTDASKWKEPVLHITLIIIFFPEYLFGWGKKLTRKEMKVLEMEKRTFGVWPLFKEEAGKRKSKKMVKWAWGRISLWLCRNRCFWISRIRQRWFINWPIGQKCRWVLECC